MKLGTLFSVTNCAFIDKQDKKRHGPLYDVDPTEQYEIDRSELEPLDHIPPLYKVYICKLFNVLKKSKGRWFLLEVCP